MIKKGHLLNTPITVQDYVAHLRRRSRCIKREPHQEKSGKYISGYNNNIAAEETYRDEY